MRLFYIVMVLSCICSVAFHFSGAIIWFILCGICLVIEFYLINKQGYSL